ncbi:hypothetical protein BYT27DRAFT_7096483 [Phlegmacium glaucopus]|nr:hypothetical protein BYT27DRAFT_7096483 [Phlegmacium glaucopus]
MDERIIHDPHPEVMPDHAGPHYNVLQIALIQNGITMEQAVQALNDSWIQNHDERVQRWDQQVIDNANAVAENPVQQQEVEDQQPAHQPPEQGEVVMGRADAEKKKAKMRDFDDAAAVGNYITPRPAQYALQRIEEFEYVELWYLTPEGCTDATQHQLTQSDDTFGLTKVDDMVTLKSVSSLKASRNVVPDTELSFRQMSMAKNTFIPLMTKHQWSDKAINAFAQFFTQLELHPYRQREFGERALILYQARVRREWHDQLKLGSAFNIGIINEDLLQSIYKEILDKAQLLSLNEVSSASPCFSSTKPANFSPPFFFSLFPLVRIRCDTSPLHHAPHSLHHVLHITHHTSCTMHHAPCTMHHAPHIMHHTSYTKCYTPCIVPHASCIIYTISLIIPRLICESYGLNCEVTSRLQ